MDLASYATRNTKGLGRIFPEVFDDSRDPFERDKDRIIHSKAFRRLDKKTQVFMAGSGDHYRTRLTHTLEVAQIARGLARRLKLNEDLCETIALAHDLGHPPFGHAGEAALNEIMQKFQMHFEHNEQSRRVVEVLEKSYPDFDGINLTLEVLDGMIKHQSAWDQFGKKFEIAAHLEAQIVNIADEIAYTNHDIDDGLRSGFITLKQLEKIELWQKVENLVLKKYGKKMDEQVFIARMISTTISLMVANLCKQTLKNIKKNKIKTVKDVKNFQGTIAEFDPKMKLMINTLRRFLYNNFYLNKQIEKLNKKGKEMIKVVFDYYLKHPQKLKKEFLRKNEPMQINIKDYIAGMTDNFLAKEYSYIMKL